MRRAGSPVHASRGPRIAKSTPAALQQLRGRARGALGALVERGGAADPVEDLRHGVARARARARRARPPSAARSACGLPHGFDWRSTSRSIGSASAREARLDHDEVAAQVDDVVDLLDVDRALAHARAAGDAVPDALLGHRRAGDRRPLVGPVGLARGERLRPLREQVVAHAHDQELGRQHLVGRVGGAGVLAAPALRARERVHHLLPREVLDGPDAEAQLLLGRLVVEPQRLQPPARARAPEVDVDRRGGDVQVLGVREVGEEAEDQQHVRPHEHALEHLGGGRRRRTARRAGSPWARRRRRTR